MCLLILLLSFFQAGFASDNLQLGIPGDGVQVVDRVGYALGYSEPHEQAESSPKLCAKSGGLPDVFFAL
jgi:hypothetical protein